MQTLEDAARSLLMHRRQGNLHPIDFHRLQAALEATEKRRADALDDLLNQSQELGGYDIPVKRGAR